MTRQSAQIFIGERGKIRAANPRSPQQIFRQNIAAYG
jgi:hypothetical protein